MRQIINYFTDDDLYKFTMCCAVIDNYPRAQVRYRFQDRDNTVYPSGFARELREQINSFRSLKITQDEIEFMKKRCPYIPYWFYSYLKGYEYKPEVVKIEQNCDGRLELRYEGGWTDTILLEVKILAVISELYFEMTGKLATINIEEFAEKTEEKARKLVEAECVFSDFGTRRRASFLAQDVAVRSLARAASGNGAFIGTSNVYLAMRHDLKPVGTMAHELIAAIGGMYGPQMANYIAMRIWSGTYRGSLGTFLYDTFGWEIFSLNFSEDYANMFRGLRVDSGDNHLELDKIVDKYLSLNIDPATKQVVFSNALTVGDAVELQAYAKGKCKPSFGIGTHFTNDFPSFSPLNIVIKLLAAKITESWPFYNDTCKLSDDPGKSMGKPEVIQRFREALHMDLEKQA